MNKFSKFFKGLFNKRKKKEKIQNLQPIKTIINTVEESIIDIEKPKTKEESTLPIIISKDLLELKELEELKEEVLNIEKVKEAIINTNYLLEYISKYDSRYSTDYKDILDLIHKLKQIAKVNKFVIFEDNSKDFNLNIWFSRNLEIEEDTFKDISITFWLDTQNKWNTRLFKWNTNPGIHYLQTPQNAQGTAIICTGQYRGTHSIRTHRAGTSSAHLALCHSQGIVKVFRDNNKDNILDLDGRVYTNGLGINVHRPTLYTERTGKVDRSSAGCLIARYRNEFDNKTQNDLTTDTFMGICRNSRLHWGNIFSITVIDDSMYK